MNSTLKLLVAGTIVGGLTVAGGTVNAQEAPYYKGKSITVIVGFSPGGGSDLAARAIANHLSKHIDGNPPRRR